MVTVMTSVWLICSLRLCEMPVWLCCSDALFSCSHGDETLRDSGFARGCWSCLSSPLASSCTLSSWNFLTFLTFHCYFQAPSAFICFFFHLLSVGLRNICPSLTCNPFWCFHGLDLFPLSHEFDTQKKCTSSQASYHFEDSTQESVMIVVSMLFQVNGFFFYPSFSI